MPPKIEVEVEINNKEERKLCCKEVVRSKRDTWFNLEKISSLQELELKAARKRSLQNINRWSLLLNKVITPGLGEKNKEIEKLKSSLLKDITIFLYKEVGTEKNSDHSPKIKHGNIKN